MDSLTYFETVTYPRLWREAYALGEAARVAGLVRECNLTGPSFITPSGAVLKVYRSAWEQGWDGWKIPAEFGRMEAALKALPTRSMI